MKNTMQQALDDAAQRVQMLVRPHSVCLIGASKKSNTASHRILKHLLDSDIEVTPVHPREAEILGRKTYPSVAKIPHVVDQAIIIVPRPAADEVVGECIAKGVKSIVMISAGYAEVSEEGRIAQNAIQEQCRRHGVTLLGPNCYGYLNNVDGVYGTGAAILERGPLPKGRIGISAQSGGMGLAVVPWVLDRYGSGMSYLVNAGNQADIDLADVISFLSTDPSTQTIVLLVEGAQGGRKLVSAVEKARSNGKPMAYLKVGKTSFGQRAALAHTGALAGADTVFAGLMQAAGAVRFSGIEEVGFAGHLLDRIGSRRIGPRIGIISVSGGVVAQVVDVFGEHPRLKLAELGESCTQTLRTRLKSVSSIANPVDLTIQAIADPQTFADAAEAVVDDPGVDTVIVVITLNDNYDTVIEAVAALAARSSKPVILLWLGTQFEGRGIDLLRVDAPALPWVQSERVLANVLAAFVDAQPETPTSPVPDLGTAGPGGAAIADELEIGRWLAGEGFSIPRGVLVKSIADVPSLIEDAGLRFPVVAKGLVDGITHKNAAGLLWLGLNSQEQLLAAAEQFFDRDQKGKLLIQEMIAFDREFLVGMKRDPAFGPVILFGAGGVEVERLGDIRYGLGPLGEASARSLIQSTKIGDKLDTAQVDALSTFLARISNALASSRFDEIDLNPIVLGRDGQVYILDGLGIEAGAAS